MNAIIVPGITDLNKGDQALVWESVRLVEDTKLFENVYILSSGDTEEEESLLCSQSLENGYKLINHILKHPRRGIHHKQDDIKDSHRTFLKQIFYSIWDFITRSFLLKISKNRRLVKLFYSKKVYETILYFQNADAIIVKGGGFIHAYGEFKAPYVIWYLLFYLKLGQKLNKKIIILPNSFGPFKGLLVKKQIKKVLDKADIIYARESISAKALSKLLSRDILVEKDLGFFLDSSLSFEIEELYDKYRLSSNDSIVGITIRPWRFPDSVNPEESYNNYIDSVKKFISYLISKKYKVALCNQSIGPNTHEDDRNAIKLVYSSFLDNSNVIWVNENLTCQQLKKLYSSFRFFIGTRFHSVIFSTTSLVPSVAIAYGGNKATGIMDDIGLEELVISINDVSFDQLRIKFSILEQNRERIINKLKLNQNSLLASRNRQIKVIEKLFQ